MNDSKNNNILYVALFLLLAAIVTAGVLLYRQNLINEILAIYGKTNPLYTPTTLSSKTISELRQILSDATTDIEGNYYTNNSSYTQVGTIDSNGCDENGLDPDGFPCYTGF